MKQSSDTEIDGLLSEQAAGWFVRLVANDLSARERREYLAWLKASSRNVEALLDIYRYHGYGRKAKLHMRVSPEGEPGENVIPFGPRGMTVVHKQTRQLKRRRARQMKVAAAIAGILVTIVAGWTLKATYFDKRIATGPGQWDRAMLSDGSVLRIGPNTRLRWSFDQNQRTIVLSEGEAVFEVAKDPSRPFIVTTHVGDVRAVGTEFGVSLMNASTAVVTVAHGKVAVSKHGDDRVTTIKRAAVAELIEDQQIVLSDGNAQPVKQVDASRELQWATGYYEFRGETVREAIEQFNRRNRLKVVMSDPAIGAIAMPFTTVKLDDPETFVLMLAARPDVQVAYESANVIRLLPE
ncbi:FecR family protein [Peristeroidobacter soli]|uniref:FecR family protein n=1 Tax=Peristeroidobacter soli TaxID=2497877 RepID=UPI00101C1FBD|nr:FecR domain-containing protein [Peristeroidobacter soli]